MRPFPLRPSGYKISISFLRGEFVKVPNLSWWREEVEGWLREQRNQASSGHCPVLLQTLGGRGQRLRFCRLLGGGLKPEISREIGMKNLAYYGQIITWVWGPMPHGWRRTCTNWQKLHATGPAQPSPIYSVWPWGSCSFLPKWANFIWLGSLSNIGRIPSHKSSCDVSQVISFPLPAPQWPLFTLLKIGHN